MSVILIVSVLTDERIIREHFYTWAFLQIHRRFYCHQQNVSSFNKKFRIVFVSTSSQIYGTKFSLTFQNDEFQRRSSSSTKFFVDDEKFRLVPGTMPNPSSYLDKNTQIASHYDEIKILRTCDETMSSIYKIVYRL